jgi:hypothetical protein
MELDEVNEEYRLPSVPKNVEILEERRDEVKRPSERALEEVAVGEGRPFEK